MQYYPPQPQPYPVQPLYGAPVQPYQPMYQAPVDPKPQLSPEEQRKRDYRRRLRRSSNSIGALLLIFFGMEFVCAFIIIFAIVLSGMGELTNGGLVIYLDENQEFMMEMLENGLMSTITFFFAGLIFCLIRRDRFSNLFPFDKIGGAMLFKLSVIGVTFSLMGNYVVDMLNKNLGLFGVENTGGSIETSSHPNILLLFLTTAVLPAFVEEFAFRGIIMGTLRPYSEGLAILVSSAAFGLMHGNFVQIPFAFACGIVFAYMDMKTNSLLPSICVHFLNNALAILYDVLIAYGVVNENGAFVIYGIIYVVTGILSLIFLKEIITKSGNTFFRLKGGNDVIPYKAKVKTAFTSPPFIIFSVFMLLNGVLTMFPSIISDLIGAVSGKS